MRGLFITATDTGVGKTILSAALLAAMVAEGERVRAHKPVITGLDEPPGEWPMDHELLASVTGAAAHEVAPLGFGPAVSPHLAAALQGKPIDPSEVLSRAQAAGAGDVTLLVEGVGGLLVPLRGRYTICDLARELGLAILIAARPGLGTINHTLLSLRAARDEGLEVRAVVLTPWPAEPTVLELSNRETIGELGEVEVQTLQLLDANDAASLARAGARLPWRRWLRSG
jgi:dethiobiotin synthetase